LKEYKEMRQVRKVIRDNRIKDIIMMVFTAASIATAIYFGAKDSKNSGEIKAINDSIKMQNERIDSIKKAL